MNILQINNCDLVGRRFNGHDLQVSLNEQGHNAYQIVLEKSGKESTTIPLLSNSELFVRSRLKNLEYLLSMNSLIYPFGKLLSEHSIFQKADIAHYHLIHNHFLSILDFPQLTSNKPSVWTVHDPWIITGHCIHPCECSGWMNGCHNCPKVEDPTFPMQVDKASQMWNIKKDVYQNLKVDIVVASDFMEKYITESPLTSHFNRVHKIPFGIKVEQFQLSDKWEVRSSWSIPESNFVISFRAEPNEVKGLKFIIEMLDELDGSLPVTILTLGHEPLPAYLIGKFQVIELGWENDQELLCDFYAASDVFLMPSLAESFGLMAVEAMAAGCPVIVFDNTVLVEITHAPECGIAVPYKNADALKFEVCRLMHSPDECKWRGKKGRNLRTSCIDMRIT
ncbi:glycosyltransferase [Paenibacillus sonchi]|uniref:Glycosyltransferase n=1 Tax=Paenibacillus sonchi TaxID=373687 RepID=A0A974PE57_9BACL|nr:glycosyltransferase [Paenibacillus sonchi]QQZ62204.1 glycosyltransferase [Paenibacillus sonchi]